MQRAMLAVIYKGRGTVASDTVGWDEYELGGSSNGTTARDGDLLLDHSRPVSVPAWISNHELNKIFKARTLLILKGS
jgi:hypothetical protein